MSLLSHVIGSYCWLSCCLSVCHAFESAVWSYLVRTLRSWDLFGHDRNTECNLPSRYLSLTFRALTLVCSYPARPSHPSDSCSDNHIAMNPSNDLVPVHPGRGTLRVVRALAYFTCRSLLTLRLFCGVRVGRSRPLLFYVSRSSLLYSPLYSISTCSWRLDQRSD